MSETGFVRLRDLQKVYGNRHVLQIAQLDIAADEILALIGPSGAGKSTLLRLLNFLEAPSQGSIEMAGETIDANQTASLSLCRCVTTVFQRPLLLQRTVYENVAYALHLRGIQAPQRVEEALQQVRLQELARQPAYTLSGGEMQRVALARAAVIQPELLLLDEPTANLDPYNVGLIEQIIRQLNQQRTTIVLVTHNLFQARRLGHRTALLLEGMLIEVGPTEEFFQSPKDIRTGRFVGGDMVY